MKEITKKQIGSMEYRVNKMQTERNSETRKKKDNRNTLRNIEIP